MSLSRLTRLSRLVASWLLAAWFAHLYVTMGLPKFRSDSFWTALFEHWGYPPSFRILIGVIEVGAGVLILVPWTATYAATALLVVMLGAGLSLAGDARWGDVLTIGYYLAGLAWIAWEWRGKRWAPSAQRSVPTQR